MAAPVAEAGRTDEVVAVKGDYVMRRAAEGDARALYALHNLGYHGPPLTDAYWARWRDTFSGERAFGVYNGTELVGMAASSAAEISAPGGKLLPMAALDGAAVLPGHTRRGLLRMMFSEQLRICARERGEVVAGLHASSGLLYGRYGFGVATRGRTLRIPTARGAFRPEVPSGGQMRLLDAATAPTRIREVYQRIAPYRPGMMSRPERWWPANFDWFVSPSGGYTAAIHEGADGADGFTVYRVIPQRTLENPGRGALLEVRELHAANEKALADLWRYVLSIDLVDEVHATMRPMDEPVEAMLADPRACSVIAVADRVWLRILDVPTVLEARSYRDAEPVVVDVVDELLPENSGRYRIGPDGAVRTDEPAGLRLGIESLGMIYLGEWAPSVLAGVGRIDVHDRAALAAADELFRTSVRPWCGTQF